MYENLLANVPTDLWIGGKWKKSSDGQRFDVIDPATENKITSVASATVEDAKAAVREGADAIVVSNHGGRQLDDTPATAEVLPRVIDAVGDSTEVLVDGGIRRGTDILKAVALGARAALVARPYWWGLAAGGSDGVRAIIDIFRSELDMAMALSGRPTIDSIDRSLLSPGG